MNESCEFPLLEKKIDLSGINSEKTLDLSPFTGFINLEQILLENNNIDVINQIMFLNLKKLFLIYLKENNIKHFKN